MPRQSRADIQTLVSRTTRTAFFSSVSMHLGSYFYQGHLLCLRCPFSHLGKGRKPQPLEDKGIPLYKPDQSIAGFQPGFQLCRQDNLVVYDFDLQQFF